MPHLQPTVYTRCSRVFSLLLLLLVVPPAALAAPVTDFIQFDVKIADAEVGGLLASGDEFGLGVALLGDLDGNGVRDVAVGARLDVVDGNADRGSVYILFLDKTGSILSQTVISSGSGDPNNALAGEPTGNFGQSIAWLGDYDGDGNAEIAVGEHLRDAPTVDSGRIWIIDIDSTGVMLSAFHIDGNSTNFTTLHADSLFGHQIGNLGDWDEDGAPEIAVSALHDDDGGNQNGAVYILYLDPSPAATDIKGYMKISDTQGGFDGVLNTGSSFGSGVAAIGDLDDDGQIDLAVGAYLRAAHGAVYILFMDPACQNGPGSCMVKPGSVEIGEGLGGFESSLNGTSFGYGLAFVDEPLDIFPDRLIVGNHGSDFGATDAGLVWLLTLSETGQVSSETRIGINTNTDAAIGSGDLFGSGVASAGDFNQDQAMDLLIGSRGEAGGGSVYLMAVDPCPAIITNPVVYHSLDDDGVRHCPALAAETSPTTLHLYVDSGALATANPLDVCEKDLGEGDEICAFELSVTLEGGFTIQSYTPASSAPPPGSLAFISGERSNDPQVGGQELRLAWIAPSPAPLGPIKIGDLEIAWDGSESLARVVSGSAGVDASLRLQNIPTSALLLPEPGSLLGIGAGLVLLLALHRRRSRGASLALALACVGTAFAPSPATAVTSVQDFTILRETGNLNWPAGVEDHLGSDIALIGDFGGDGVPDFALGAPEWNTCNGTEATYIVFTDATVTPIGYEGPISKTSDAENFGMAVEAIDLDGDDVNEVAVGAPGCANSAESSRGAVVLVTLDEAGREAGRVRIGNGDFGYALDLNDQFGHSLAHLGDIDGDPSNVELLVGAPLDDDGGGEAGAVYILSLAPDGTVDWAQKIATGLGGFTGGAANDRFGYSVEMLGDLDGSGPSDFAIAVGATRDNTGPGTDLGAVWILFLNSTGPGNVSVSSHTQISATTGGFAEAGGVIAMNDWFGTALAFQPIADGDSRGILYASRCGSSCFSGAPSIGGSVHVMYLDNDGTVRSHYLLNEGSGHGFFDAADGWNIRGFGRGIEVLGHFAGDEEQYLAVGARYSGGEQGGVIVLTLQDSDHDGLDDAIDNCPGITGPPEKSHNPRQEDADGDGVGDVCDICAYVSNPANTVATDCNGDLDTLDPGEGIGEQCDVDADGEGDACEPVEIQLITTGTPAAPSWDLKLECGAFDVTDVNAAIVLPVGASADSSCSGPPYPTGCLTLAAGSLGTGNMNAGPGLVSPSGVRDDAIYFSAVGLGTPPANPLCSALDPPVLLGTLSAGAIAGTELAAAALAEEGVGTPGFALSLAKDGSGPISETKVRLVNGVPLPILDIELGPAVLAGTCNGGTYDGQSCDAGSDCLPGGTCDLGKRWDVLLKNATTEFHRVAFGLIAPFGTTTSDMRWIGCESTSTPSGARALVAGERSCAGGTGFGVTISANDSWTVGPQATAPGTQLDHTLYVVLEGGRDSEADLLTLNPANVGPVVVLGTVELDGNPDLEPALTTDGANDLDDLFNTGFAVAPYKESDDFVPLPDPTQVKLVGAFNPADDVDADGIQDLADNCPFQFNPSQDNDGSFLSAVADSDALGDACQCAESTGDGAVTDPDDFEDIFDLLAGKITNPVVAAEIEERCSVVGTTECNILDLLVLGRAMDAGDPSVETRCDAALSPAP